MNEPDLHTENTSSGITSSNITSTGNISSDNTPSDGSLLNGNKGLSIAIALGVIVSIVGVSAFFNSGSGSQFEGLIKKVEVETQQLKSKAE